MNFLQICQRVRQEAGVSGNGPSSVLNQSGESRRLVDWSASAYDDIQLDKPNWMWMRDSFTFTTATPGDYSFTSTDAGIASRFSKWEMTSLRCYKTSIGVNDGVEIPFIPYEDFRSIYLTGAQDSSRPVCFTIAPNLSIYLGPAPDVEYTIIGEYWKNKQTLAADADIPDMPADYHMAIVYRALMKYARFEAAGEIYDDARMEYRRIMNKLYMNQLPNIETPAPLA